MINPKILRDILKDACNALKNLKDNYSIKYKMDGSQFKSNADILSNKIIQSHIKRYSSYPILSEEDSSSWSLIDSEFYWLIDPLDGTASYCEGFSGYVSQICLMKNFTPILSAIYAPEFNLFFHAIKGKGAFCNFQKIVKNPYCDNNLTLIDNYPEPKRISKKVFKKFNCVKYIESGSLGLKICRIAEGYADIFVKDVKTKIWDLAPGDLLLKELDSGIINLNGSRIKYNNLIIEDGILCTRDLKLSRKIYQNLL